MTIPRTPDTAPSIDGVTHPSTYAIRGEQSQWKFRFDNGFGASVVQGPHTYGRPLGLYELAVLGQDGHLTYDTPVTDDVLGHLTAQDVQDALDRIAALPKPEVSR